MHQYLSYLPSCAGIKHLWSSQCRLPAGVDLAALIPDAENAPFDIKGVINGLIDEGSFFEIKQRFAKEIVTGFARLDGAAIGIIANNSKYLGGVLFKDSADKAAKFISICDAFGLPLLFLADVPGFMIGSKVEREGIIRHGAKMLRYGER